MAAQPARYDSRLTMYGSPPPWREIRGPGGWATPPDHWLPGVGRCAITLDSISPGFGGWIPMAQVIVRNLDDRVVRALKARAALHGRALEQELREILTRASELSPEERLELVDRIRAMAPRPSTDSVDLIREDRDSR